LERAAGFGAVPAFRRRAVRPHFASRDADATQAAIVEAGGSVLFPAGDVGAMGRMLIAADPSGAVFGVWQAGQMDGFGAPGTTGSFAWCDLRSTDPDAARDFYAAVFGFTYTPLEMAGPAYATFSLGGDGPPMGGMGDMMGSEGIPSHWLVYLAVADADGSAAAARDLGGAVLADRSTRRLAAWSRWPTPRAPRSGLCSCRQTDAPNSTHQPHRGSTAGCVPDFDDVARRAESLPDVSERERRDQRTWFVSGKRRGSGRGRAAV
jgi:predicted enzyme related to lactoylglutathione lyase